VLKNCPDKKPRDFRVQIRGQLQSLQLSQNAPFRPLAAPNEDRLESCSSALAQRMVKRRIPSVATHTA
jgi:hypothetical protein